MQLNVRARVTESYFPLFFLFFLLLYSLLLGLNLYLFPLLPALRASFPPEVKWGLKERFALKYCGPESSWPQHGAQWRACVRMNN